MFVADKFILLRMPKTGSTHLAKLLGFLVPGVSYKQSTRIGESLPAGDRPIFGTVRNPWEWYVSLWAYGCTGYGTLYKAVTERKLRRIGWKDNFGGALAIASREIKKPVEEWRQCYVNSHDPELFRRWLNLLMDPARSSDLPEGFADFPTQTFAGFMTHRYMRLYLRDLQSLTAVGSVDDLIKLDREQCLPVGFIRNERLEADLIAMLEQVGCTLDEVQLNVIHSAKKSNVSDRNRDLSFYYDRETANLVRERDALIISKFGYSSPI